MAMANPTSIRAALIVVDMQEDFCPPSGSLAVSGGRDIAPAINELLSLPFALKIATKDWHPSDHISFSTSHDSPDIVPFKSTVTIDDPDHSSKSLEIPIWPVHCVQGTKGAEIIPEIDVSKIDQVVQKGRDKRVEMFSGFSTCFGAKSDAASHDLGELLRKADISHVFVAGLAGDFCVRHTAIDAKKEGFIVCVIDEATRSVDPGSEGWGAVKRELDDNGIHVHPELPSVAASNLRRDRTPITTDSTTTNFTNIKEPFESAEMPSSKGKPTDPKLREEVKEDVKNETNKDGSGKGQMAAWKGQKIAKEYEKKGGGYENEAGSENKPQKGAPEGKSEEEKKQETAADEKDEDRAETKDKPKANSGKKAATKKADTKAKTPKKAKKEPAKGTRQSSRVANKRAAPEEETEEPKEKAPPAKKAKTAKK